MPELDEVIADLKAEGDALESLVVALPPERWKTQTPAVGWTIAHQIGHLLWTDRASLLSITDPDAFVERLGEAAKNPTGFVDEGAEAEAKNAPGELYAQWRAERIRLASALAAVPYGTKLPWYGPPMSAMSMATARLMETWAHGLDVADSLGVQPIPTNRLRSIAHLGVRTRDFAYSVNELTPPAQPFRIELTAPEGEETWTWGPDDAAQRITGPALDFCLLVTQRAHRDDLALEAVGDDARFWLGIAQTFAGPSGSGREAKANS